MAKTLSLEVVTPEKSVLKEEIESLVVPAANGYLGVLPNHAPLITGLQAGILKYKSAGKTKYMSIGGGFMEVFCNRVTVLADTAEQPQEGGKNSSFPEKAIIGQKKSFFLAGESSSIAK